MPSAISIDAPMLLLRLAPVVLAVLILGAVALVTALAALVFEMRAMRSHYGLRQRHRAAA
jgi:hypothetical protein